MLKRSTVSVGDSPGLKGLMSVGESPRNKGWDRGERSSDVWRGRVDLGGANGEWLHRDRDDWCYHQAVGRLIPTKVSVRSSNRVKFTYWRHGVV